MFLSTKSILSVTYIAVKILNSTMLYLIISYIHAPSCFPRRFAEPLAFGISRHRCVSRACFRSVVEIVTHCTLSYGRHHCSRQKQSNLLTQAFNWCTNRVRATAHDKFRCAIVCGAFSNTLSNICFTSAGSQTRRDK